MNDSTLRAGPEVDVAFVAAHLDDPSVRIVELDVSAAAYQAGHIPGAVLWNAYTDLRQPGYERVSHHELQELVRNSGIAADTTVVVYGYGAHLGYWLLKSCGHGHVKLLDGSRDRWTKDGHAWSVETPAHQPSGYELGPQDRYIASEADVRAMVDERQGLILDVRSGAEYAGVNFWPSGAPETTGRAGRIPGAVHLPVDEVRTADAMFIEERAMQRILQSHSIDPSAEIVTYCTIGNRASQVWYALTVLLGYGNVRVYYGSWVEWGMRPEAAVEA